MRALILLLFGGAVAGAPPEAPPRTLDPQAQLAEIQKDANKAVGDAIKSVAGAKSEEDVARIKQQIRGSLATLHQRAIDLAAKHARENVASKALVWVVENRGPGPQSAEVAKALTILRADHAKSDFVAALCERLDRLDSAESEAFLRAVAADNPSRVTKGKALYNIACLLRKRADARYNDDPRASAQSLQEAERTLAELASDYADVKDGSRTLADRARRTLDDLRRLSCGKPAPEVEGEDGDGKRFRLSDYKGKVVVIDFWAGW